MRPGISGYTRVSQTIRRGFTMSLRTLVRFAPVVVLMSGILAPAANASTSCGAPPSAALIQSLVSQAPGLKADVLRMGMAAASCAKSRGLVSRPEILTVIDYSIPSTSPRLFVFNTATKKLLFREHVAHGRNSGGNMTTRFSNVEGSNASSLGLFVTANTYMGSNGYSLRLKGLEPGVNDRAWARAIVMHGAAYVNASAAKAMGRLGRSLGCPAVRTEVSRKLIDTVKGGSAIFAYYPDNNWLASSAFFRGNTPAPGTGTATTARAASRR